MPPFDFYETMVNSGYIKQPNEYYRSLQQAFVDSQWDNTSAKTPESGGLIEEQSDIGSDVYDEIEAWVAPTVADVSSGSKDSNDFLKMIFRDITHTAKRGQYYRFDGNYWIVHTYNQFNSLTQYVGVRRCNNWLRVIDPADGSIYEQPCVVGYDMSSPSIQVNSSVITPNNHATITTQGNDKALRLFKLNTRFIISGRPFKLYAYQNALSYSATDEQPTYLELDLYLDEVHDGDDFERGVAYNGDYDYTVEIYSSDLNEPVNSTNTLRAGVKLNGSLVDNKQVKWASSDDSIVKITSQDGLRCGYQCLSEGETTITATLDDNPDAYDTITITVTSQGANDYKLIVVGLPPKIKQYQSVTAEIKVSYNGMMMNPADSAVVVPENSAEYFTVAKDNNKYTFTCLKIAPEPFDVRFVAIAGIGQIKVEDTVSLQCVSMLG